MVLHKIERKVIPNLLIVWYLSPVRSFFEEISNWQLYLSSSPKACSCDQHLYWGCLVHLLPNWFVLNPESWSRSPSPFSWSSSWSSPSLTGSLTSYLACPRLIACACSWRCTQAHAMLWASNPDFTTWVNWPVQSLEFLHAGASHNPIWPSLFAMLWASNPDFTTSNSSELTRPIIVVFTCRSLS